MHQARIVHRGIYGAEAKSAHIVYRQTELGVIEEIEELSAEIQTHLSRQCELFNHGEVRVDKIRPDSWDPRRIPQLADGGHNKAGGVDPLELSVVRVVRVATRDLGRPVPIISIAAVLEVGAGLVITVDQGNRKSRRDSLNKSQLETAKKGVGHVAPIATELLSVADGQIVNDTARETVIEINLR